MRVSKLLQVLFVVLFAMLSFALSPITAGEHPWDENENTGGGTDSTTPGQGYEQPDDDGTGGTTLYKLFGSPFIWLQIVISGPVEDAGNGGATSGVNVPGTLDEGSTINSDLNRSPGGSLN